MSTDELRHLKILMQSGNYSEVMRIIESLLEKRKGERNSLSTEGTQKKQYESDEKTQET